MKKKSLKIMQSLVVGCGLIAMSHLFAASCAMAYGGTGDYYRCSLVNSKPTWVNVSVYATAHITKRGNLQSVPLYVPKDQTNCTDTSGLSQDGKKIQGQPNNHGLLHFKTFDPKSGNYCFDRGFYHGIANGPLPWKANI